MKLVPVFQIIKGKKFVLIDDSIVRGTQFEAKIPEIIKPAMIAKKGFILLNIFAI